MVAKGSKGTAKANVKEEVAKEVKEEMKGKRGRTSNRDLAMREEKKALFVGILATHGVIDTVKEGDQYQTIYLHPHGQIIIKSRNLIAKGSYVFNPENAFVHSLNEEESRYYMGGDALVNLDTLDDDDINEFANDTVNTIKSAKGRKTLREIVEEARANKS